VHPLAALLGSLLVIAAFAAGLPRLRFSNDIEVFFDKSNPQLKAYRDLESTYNKWNSVLFVVEAKNGNVFTRENLAALEFITKEALQIPYSRKVDSLINFQNSFARGDELIVENLVGDVATLSESNIVQIRQVALSEPLLVNRLVSPTGHVAGVNVPVRLPGKDQLKEQPEVATAARNLAVLAEQKFPSIKVHLTGIVMINQALAEAGLKDMSTLMPAMFGLMVVGFMLLLRTWTSALAALLVIILANVAAYGFAGWLGITLSPPAISGINMIMTLAVADSVHILTTFMQNVRSGMQKREAMAESLISQFSPVFFTSFTTVLGFLSLNTSDSPPFRDLGNIVAAGVTFAWIFVFTILPPVILLLPLRVSKQSNEPSGVWGLALGDWICRHRKMVLGASAIITLVPSIFILRNQLDDEFVTYFDKSVPFRQATEFTIKNLTGFENIQYSINSAEPGGISNPEYLRKLDAFAAWYRQQPKVRHVYSYTDIIKRLHRNMNQDEPAFHRLPDNRELAAQCLLLYEMSLPFGNDLTDQVNIDKSATLFRVSLSGISSSEMIALDKRATAWLNENGLSPGTEGTGQSLVFAYIGIRNIKSLLGGTVAALVLISLCMVWITHSWKLGFLSLLPNLAPAAMAFGFWGIFVGEVGLALSVVVGMTLGIVVDDSIHLLHHYIHLRRDDASTPENAVRETMKSVFEPMISSTVILVGGFGVLAFSSFELNRSMGLLSAITIAIALFFDLFALPALLLAADRRRRPVSVPPAAPITAANHV
jgi:uncharacterized protein